MGVNPFVLGVFAEPRSHPELTLPPEGFRSSQQYLSGRAELDGEKGTEKKLRALLPVLGINWTLEIVT